MTARQVLLRVEESIAIIEFANPPLNVVTLQMTEQLGNALDAISENSSIRAVVLTGGGSRAFCAGSDISEFHDFMGPGQIVEKKLRKQNIAFNKLENLRQPTIAAIDGLAFGGGLEIALCCDLIVASEDSRLALPEIKLGVFPSSGGTIRLTRRIGAGRAKEMMFLAEGISAATASAWGLVNRVAPVRGAMPVARETAMTLARRPPLALSLCKSLINGAFDASFDDLLERSFAASDRAFSSPECAEGVRAFQAKESARF